MDVEAVDSRMRAAAFAWLDERKRKGEELVTHDELAGFRFEGVRVPLIDPQRGIRKPSRLDAALSFRTTFTPPGRTPPYEDMEGPDGLVRYKYRGNDQMHPENVALRKAYERQLPLIWFVGVKPGVFLPVYPVWLRADEPDRLQFAVAVEDAQRFMPVGSAVEEGTRRYVERLTRQRLHQPVFRTWVLQAYEERCAMCHLRHANLLDAAHIIPDGRPHGEAVVPNGLALCKIHHAAFDLNFLGIRPDLVIEVADDIIHEADGPMLKHGLQEMAGVSLVVPRTRAAQPDRERLEERYEEFRQAS